MDSTPLAAFRTALIAERDALAALHQSSADSRKVVELDQTTVGRLSRIDALQGQAMAQAAARNRQLRAVAIAAALRRIEAGDFGWCEGCGEAINPKRLEIDPTFTHYVACADGSKGG